MEGRSWKGVDLSSFIAKQIYFYIFPLLDQAFQRSPLQERDAKVYRSPQSRQTCDSIISKPADFLTNPKSAADLQQSWAVCSCLSLLSESDGGESKTLTGSRVMRAMLFPRGQSMPAIANWLHNPFLLSQTMKSESTIQFLPNCWRRYDMDLVTIADENWTQIPWVGINEIPSHIIILLLHDSSLGSVSHLPGRFWRCWDQIHYTEGVLGTQRCHKQGGKDTSATAAAPTIWFSPEKSHK